MARVMRVGAWGPPAPSGDGRYAPNMGRNASTAYSRARFSMAGGKLAKRIVRPAACAARTQASTNATAAESAWVTAPKSKTSTPSRRCAVPSSSSAGTVATVTAPSRRSRLPSRRAMPGRRIAGAASGRRALARPGLELAVLVGERLDQALDAGVSHLARERVPIRGHEADAANRYVVDLPAAGGLLEVVVDGHGLRSGLPHLRAHDDVGVRGRRPKRFDVDDLIAIGRERRRIGAHEQRPELLDEELLLLRGRLAPVHAHRERRHAGEVEVREHLLLDQGDRLARVARQDVFVLLDDRDHFLGDGPHEDVGRHVLAGRGGNEERPERADESA